MSVSLEIFDSSNTDLFVPLLIDKIVSKIAIKKNRPVRIHVSFDNGLADFASFRRDQNIMPKGCLAQISFQAIDRLGEKSRAELEALGDKTLDIFKKWVTKSNISY